MADLTFKVEDNGAIDRIKSRLEELVPLLERVYELVDELKKDDIQITVK